MTDININARMFYAAAICRSTEEVRYYLNGVFVTSHPEGGVLLVAMDGHLLLCVKDATGACKKDAIIGLPEGLPRELSRKLENPRLIVDGKGILSIPGAFLSDKSALIDGTFPDWRKVVIPVRDNIKNRVRAEASFNGEKINTFAKIAKVLAGDQSSYGRPIRIINGKADDPALILFPNSPEAFGVLMPMRADVETGLPAWMRPVLEPLEQKVAAPVEKLPVKRRSRPKAKAKKPTRKNKLKKAA